jgi:hypothetical protein
MFFAGRLVRLSIGGTLESRDDWLRELDEKALDIVCRLVLPSLQPPSQQLGESPGNIARACVPPPSGSGKERNFFREPEEPAWLSPIRLC